MRTSDPGEGGTPRPPAGGTAVPPPPGPGFQAQLLPHSWYRHQRHGHHDEAGSNGHLNPHVCVQGPHCRGGVTQPLPKPCPCYLPLGEVSRTQARSPWGLTTRLTPTHPLQKVSLDTHPWGRQRAPRNARETAEAQMDEDSSEGQRARGVSCSLPVTLSLAGLRVVGPP